ncbi:MAG: sigma-70 family RNA polymerase sigma factor [Pseudomonadota bacterium]|nr:sigma-70 family RNA polymerase sigma factor [Pseudomonadota bacterium]
MAAAQGGDAAAYREVLRASIPLAASVARRRGVAAHQVDDVVQDVLLTVHRARATYDPARPFAAWLRAIAERRAIDALRRHGRQAKREVHDPIAYDAHVDQGVPAGEALDRAERARELGAAIATLPEGQRQAVERLGLHEQSLDEAAAETGRSKGALKVNLHRALKSLRGRLSADGQGANQSGADKSGANQSSGGAAGDV